MADEIFDPNLTPSPYGVLWDAPGTKSYYIGVDRGVLYIGEIAVPWIGLTSVEEKPTGGEIVPFYIDGIRRRHDHMIEEFSASVSAYTYPKEFSVCLGEVSLAPGLYLGQQPREPFGFSYRNFVGNDLGGPDAAYQLNIVYEAMANPMGRKYATQTLDSTPDTLSWDIETLPVDVFDNAPSARIRLDSREIPADLLNTIELILYGTPDISPRMPSIDELREILTTPEELPPEEEIDWEYYDPTI